MIIAGVVLKEEDLNKLKAIGVKDSKLLTQKQREKLVIEIKEIVLDYKVIKIYPAEIDAALESEENNLNWLEGDKMAEVINYLKPDKVIVDCPSTNKKAFTNFLNKKIKVRTELLCEHKADLNFYECGAASILAKCSREEEVKLLKQKIGKDFGSGYPADPITKKFLKENWDKYPEIFRHSWAPYQEFSIGKKSKKQKSLVDF